MAGPIVRQDEILPRLAARTDSRPRADYINSFFRSNITARFRYGFDESILNVDAEQQPTPFVGLRRAYSLALGGWAPTSSSSPPSSNAIAGLPGPATWTPMSKAI